MRALVFTVAMLLVTLAGFAQYNMVPNYSFESGTAQNPDASAELYECDHWESVGTPDWHTTQVFGSSQWHLKRTHGPSLGTSGWGGPNCSSCPLQDPYRGDYMAAIGNCEGLYLHLNDETFDFAAGCQFSLSFMIAARDFYTSQQTNPWYDQIDVLFCSSQPGPFSGLPTCSETFNEITEYAVSHQLERGYQNGVVVDDFVPGQWLRLTFNNLVWNDAYEWMMIRMAPQQPFIPQNFGYDSKNYYYIDDVTLTRSVKLLEESVVIDQWNEDDETTYDFCNYIQTATGGSYHPVFTGTQFLTAGNYIEVLPVSLIQPADPEKFILLQANPCYNCNGDAYVADFRLCLCNASEDPCEVVLATPNFLLTSPVPTISGYTYQWSSTDPIMNAFIYTPNSPTTAVMVPPMTAFPFCEVNHHFLFYLKEFNGSGQLVNTYPLEVIAYNECTRTEYQFLNGDDAAWPMVECEGEGGRWAKEDPEKGSDGISVFPNPSNDVMTISFGTPGTYKLVVHNAMGQVMREAQAGTGNFQLEKKSLGAGVFFLTVWNDSELLFRRAIVFSE